MAQWDLRILGWPTARRRPVTVLTVRGYLGDGDVLPLTRALTAEGRLGGGRLGRGLLVCDLRALTEPDLATVGALARLKLTAGRAGCDFAMCGCRALAELIALAGLDGHLPAVSELPGPLLGTPLHDRTADVASDHPPGGSRPARGDARRP